MTFPSFVQTREVSIGTASLLISADPLVIEVTITPSRGLVWDATGDRFEASTLTTEGNLGESITMTLPCTDVVGWRDSVTGALIDVSAPGSYTHTYAGTIRFLDSTKHSIGKSVTLGRFVLPVGDGSPVDLDKLLPVPGVSGGSVLVPDSWSALVADAVAAAAASSSTITADDTPAAPAEGESASYFVTSAVVWPAGLVWSTVSTSGPAIVTLYTVGGITYAVLGATFPAPVVPDTTAPTVPAGLSATATGTATVDLSWSASTDAGGVTGYEYAINAGAAVDAGAGTTETVSGLAAATLYSFTVRAYDAAGNRSAWSTAATATTQAPPDTTAPTWTATVTMGTPTETSVVATASALAADNSGSVTYEVSYNSGSTWAAIVPSGSNFTLAGSPSTTYATTKLRAKDAAGNYSTPVLSVPSYTMAASDDVTGPTVGTMSASSITSSGFTLTVSSAADEAGGSGLHATPYAFTTDGTNYGAYQASPVYTASGLAASTSYSCNWRVRDAAGNVSTGTAQTVTTGAGATVIAADTFTRADSDTLGTTEVGAKAWADGAWRVASNKANQPSAGESVAIIYALPADCTVSATFTLGTARACAGLLFRYADASNQWQAALVKTAGLSQVELSKRVGAAFTRDIYPTALSLGGTYSLEVTASGSSITVKLDGAIIITKTDSYASTATIAGLWSYVAADGDDGTTTVDNFEVRSIT